MTTASPSPVAPSGSDMSASSGTRSAFRRVAVGVLACAAALVLASNAAAQGCSPWASPPAGPMCGTSDSALVDSTTVTVNAFWGIPYAVPTTANNNAGRWQPPDTAPAWTDTLQATQFASICPQFLPDSAGTAYTVIGGDEDCLYLNVWQPVTATDTSSLPVMVFIHGGTFIAGAGSLGAYDGAYLAASGNVIVVTLNYRLGALGWLATDTLQLSIPPNLGLQDQQLALGWVRANIGAFGGDSTQVTVFGESAGAMSVGLHLFSAPASAPLFRGAIMESNLMGFPYKETAQAQADGASFVSFLCPASDCPGTMGWLQGLSTEQILLADSVFRGGLYFADRVAEYNLSELIPWSPVVDGAIVLGQPVDGYAAGMTPKPYVFGTNTNEGVLFASMVASIVSLSELEYDVFIEWLYPGVNDSITSFADSTGYQPYSGSNAGSTAYMTSQETALSNVLNDDLFQCGNLAAADSALAANQADSLPVFGYLFTQPPVFNHPPVAYAACVPAAGNVCHTYELPYVFYTFANAAAQPGSNQPAAADSTLAQAMSAAWVSFATTLGAPTPGWQPYASGGLYVWGSGTGAAASHNCAALWDTIPPLGT